MGAPIRYKKIDLASIDDPKMREQLAGVNEFMSQIDSMITTNFILQSAGSPKGWQRPHANPGPDYADRAEIDDMLKQDAMLEIARGNVTGQAILQKFGMNPATAATEDIHDAGGTYPWPSEAQTHTVAGGAADDVGGTGALTVRVWGLDANWALQDETVTMAGAGGVTTSGSYIRIFRMKVITAGTGGTNSGAITATGDEDSTVTATIQAAKGQTYMAIYTVPAGKTLYLTGLRGSISRLSTAVAVELELFRRENADAANAAWTVSDGASLVTLGTGYVYQPVDPPVPFAAKTDMRIYCNDVSAGTPVVYAGFGGVLVDD